MEEEDFFGYEDVEADVPRNFDEPWQEEAAWEDEGITHDLGNEGMPEYAAAEEEIEEEGGIQIGLDYATLQSVSAMPFQTNLPGMRAAQGAMRTPAARILSTLEREIESLSSSKSGKIRQASLEMAREMDPSRLAFCHVPTMAVAMVFVAEKKTIEDASPSFWKKVPKEVGSTIPDVVRYIRILQMV